MMEDRACTLNWETAELGDLLGAPTVPPSSWFDGPPDGVDLRRMAFVDVCGEVGRFYSTLGEVGQLFSTPFGETKRVPDIRHALYMNGRQANRMAMLDGRQLVERAAGAIGFTHSPSYLTDLDQINQWHRREGFSNADRALIRARFGRTGKILWVAGAVVATATKGEVLEINNAEISMEFGRISTPHGRRDEVVGASLVLAGNATTKADDYQPVPLLAAGLGRDRITITDRGEMTEGDIDMAQFTDDEAGKLLELIGGGVDRACACNKPAAGEVDRAETDTEAFAELQAQVAELSEVVAMLVEAQSVDQDRQAAELRLVQ